MTINDIISALDNRNDFSYLISKGEQVYSPYFDNYFNIPTEWLDMNIKSFTIGWEEIIFYV